MVSSAQAKIFVHLLPSLIPPGSLSGGVAVVVDVLRATTVMVHALAAGCDCVIPCGEIDEAKAAAAQFPEGAAVLGGERGGLPIPGFDPETRPENSGRRSAGARRLS
jgi:2-phosphosulfolactate phosphatase